MALGIALRYVLEALRKPPGTKMYMFGTTALDRFKIRLKDYPHYCQHLASIPHYKEFPSHLVEYIGFGQRNQEPPNPVINRTTLVCAILILMEIIMEVLKNLDFNAIFNDKIIVKIVTEIEIVCFSKFNK